MNPNRGGEQSFSQVEAGPIGSQEQYAPNSSGAETAPATPESSPSRQSYPPITTPIVMPPQNPVAVAPPLANNDTQSNAAPGAPTKDADRIDKQWVEKAKSIISQTKDDPFMQKKEMSKVKAAYIEKRFNKKLKVDDAVV